MVIIRKAFNSDAEEILRVLKNAEESGFMLFNPGERNITPEIFAKFIDTTNENEKSGVFVAIEEDQIQGYMFVQNEKPNRISHRAYVVIGIHSASRGKGIGKALFAYINDWAKKVKLHRLELTVMTKNYAAVALYKKMGFEIEGVKRDSLLIQDKYVDEYYMSKLI